MPVTVTKSGPGIAGLAKALERIKRSDVLVGIPAQKASRRGKGQTINNAEAMFLFSKGSPLRNQPPRPWLEPAIEKSKQIITPHLEAAARAVLEQDPARAERELKLAGIVASNAAKKYPVEANGWAPNAPSTIRQKGSDRPGISTGQLRRSIVSVVRENGKETDAT
jgi:hypothetical protein